MPTSNPSETEKTIKPESTPEGDKPIAAKSPLATFIAGSLGIKPKEEKPKKPDPDKEGDDEDKEAEAAPAKPSKAVKQPVAAPAPAIDEEKLGRSIAEGLAPHLKAAKESKPEPDMDPQEKRRLDVLFYMEQMPEFGDRYKGLAERYKANKAKLRDYAKQWETKNPGHKFSEEDAEHADYLEKLEKEVEYDDDDFAEARADIRAGRKFDEQKVELDRRLAAVERQELARKEEPKAHAVAAQAGNEYWKELGDEFKEIVSETGGINLEALNAIKRANPVKYDTVLRAATAVEQSAAAIHMLANGLEAFNPKNQLHNNLASFAVSREQTMLARSPEAQLDEQGRKFVTKEQLEAMSERQRAKHWTFSAEDLIFMATRAIASKARQDIESEDKKFLARAKAEGFITDDEAPPKEQPKAGGEVDDVDDDDADMPLNRVRKPLSPTSAAMPKAAVTKGASGAGAKTGLERWVSDAIA